MYKNLIQFLLSLLAVILFLNSGCSKKGSPTEPDDPQLIVAPTAKVLADSIVAVANSISPEGDILKFGEQVPGIAALKVNDVIVSSLHRGFARRITSMERIGGEVVITTAQADLTDIFQEAQIEMSRPVTSDNIDSITLYSGGERVNLHKASFATENGFSLPIEDAVLFDLDGNYVTVDDQIRLDGNYSAIPSLEFRASIRGSQVRELMFSVTMDETLELTLSASIHAVDKHEKKLIGEVHLNPIVVWAGFVPVVLTPTIGLYAGFDGTVEALVTTGITATSTSRLGVWYKDSDWSLIKDYSSEFTNIAPTLSVELMAKAYAGPEYNLLIYGVAGPYLGVHGYLSLEAHYPATPWWELFAGAEATAGVKVQVLDKIIEDKKFPAFLDYRKRIAVANGGAQGEINGIVQDAVTNSPIAGANLVISLSGSGVAYGLTDALGTYRIAVPVGDGYSISVSKEGYLTVNYYNVSINSVTSYFLQTVLQIAAQYDGIGSVGGRIVNALDGTGVSGVTVAIRPGINNTSGSPVAEELTNGQGSYLFTNLPAGNYSAYATATGFNPSSFSMICIGNMSIQSPDATMTPILTPGETRIILNWGSVPSDLDSHLFGPSGDGETFHLYYPWAQSNYGSPWPDYVKLDLDDVSSYGPETVTIYHQLNGVYTYKVHDYTNRYSNSNTALSWSGAQVRVYQGSNLVAAFNVPPNSIGTVWTVFTLQGSTLIPVNTMEYDPDIFVLPYGVSGTVTSKVSQ